MDYSQISSFLPKLPLIIFFNRSNKKQARTITRGISSLHYQWEGELLKRKGRDTLATVRGCSGLEGGIATSPLCLLPFSLCLPSYAPPVHWETEKANTLRCGLRFKLLDLCLSSPQPCGKSNVTFRGKILFSLYIKLEVFT